MHNGRILFLFLLFTAQFCYADIRVGNLNQNNDQQFWFEQNINAQINSKWSFLFHSGERIGDDYRRFWFLRQWVMLEYDCTEFLQKLFCISKESAFQSFTIGPSYSKSWSIQGNKNGIRHWANSDRPGAAAFMTHNWCGWMLRQRLFAEYIDFVTPHYRNHGIYRHRAILNAPWKLTCYQLNPFFSNEWFFREESVKNGIVIQSGPFYENRLRIGISAQFSKCLAADIWWQQRANKQLPGSKPLWRKTYQIGITVNIQN